MTYTEKHITEITAYIQKWGPHLDEHFAERADVAGKRLLVIGSGWGSEVLWALKRGAAEVVGLDLREAERAFVEAALADQGLSELAARFTLHQGTALSVGEIGGFDLILSNNVFEHVEPLSANLAALARFLPDPGGRIHLFADPLYHSSMGHHLPIGPWEHLSEPQQALRERVTSRQWKEYRTGLNGMTIDGFLGAVREAGLILLQLGILPDPNLEAFNEVRKKLPPGLKPMDLCLSGISCTLAFPHNL